MRIQVKKPGAKKESVGSRRGMAFFRLNEKAGQGLRMVMAWCMQCAVQLPTVTRTRVMAVLLFAIAFCALLQYLLTSEGLSGGPIFADCSCSAADGEPSFSQPDTAVIYLDRPQRPFHGNHWFHMGEYYLSRRGIIQKKLGADKTFQHIKIIAQNHKLTGPMTEMAFSILVLAWLRDQHEDPIESIELFAPKTVALHPVVTSAGESVAPQTRLGSSSSPQHIPEGSAVKFTSQTGPIFGYYVNIGNPDRQFVDYRSLEQSTQQRRKSKANKRQRSDIIAYDADAADGSEGSEDPEPSGDTDGGSPQEPELDLNSLPTSEPLSSTVPRSWIWPFRAGSSSAAQRSSRQRCGCGVYAGSVGPAPIPTTEWFASAYDADNLHHTALAMCDVDAKYDDRPKRADTTGTETMVPAGTPETVTTTDAASAPAVRFLRLLIYQRDLNRRFSDLPSLEAQLSNRDLIIHGQQRPDVRWEVTVLRHTEQLSPCSVIKALSQADVFLTAHGFQSTGLMFMKPGAVLIEIFPYKYHRTTYMPLAARFGLHYRSIQNPAPAEGSGGLLQSLAAALTTGAPSAQLLRMVSQGACMRDLKCRSYARSRDISMPSSHLQLVLQVMQDVESGTL